MDDRFKKPSADFVVRLVGPGMTPWAVPMRTLARVLEAIQRMVDPEDEADQETAPRKTIQGSASARALRLLDVQRGSAAYPIAAPERESTLKMLRATGKAIGHPERVDWSNSAISSIEDLSEIARSLQCEIEIMLPGERKAKGDVIAKITPLTYGTIVGTAFIHGPSSIFGKIERVGGATEMHCGVHLANQVRMVICRVATAELVRDLGRYMYQNVMLSGEATWLRHNWHIKHFKITGFEPPKTGSIRDALRRIHDAGGKAWDDVKDPDKYINDMRGA